MPVGLRVWLGWLRKAGLVGALLVAAVVLERVLDRHYPIGEWLFWRYALAWIGAIVFALSSLIAGDATVRLVLDKRRLPLGEHAAVSFAVGVYEFYLGMFVAGLFKLYGTAFFLVWPSLLAASGATSCIRYWRRVLPPLVRRARREPWPWWGYPLAGFGLISLGLIYFSILTPENAAFDSRWQHLGLAEHYVAAGGIIRFPEGWFVATSPHLAATLYTWAFLVPSGELFDKVELAAHVEFVCFLWSVFGIGALVRLIVPHSSARFAWVARFVFPGIFLYDSSLTVAADHIAAVFAVPIFVLLLRAWRDLDARMMLLLGTVVTGAIMTKYTGALLLTAGPAIAIGVRAAMLLVRDLRDRSERQRRFRWAIGIAVLAGAGLVLTAPHWAKNWAWYGDPMYPVMHRHFAAHPWTKDAAERFEVGFVQHDLWQPPKNWQGLKDSVLVLATFSFAPHDWPGFHGNVPVFGSLFTLCLLAVPFLRGTRRLWGLYGAVHVGIFTWYWTHHQDRYLQAALPWMAACVAAVLILVWRSGWIARAAALPVVLLQIVWGGDVYFIPGHAMIKSPIPVVTELLSAGYAKNYASRLNVFTPYSQVASALPRGARVLVHDFRPRVGVGAMTVNDAPINQGGISYGLLQSPKAIFDLLRSYGTTHLLWSNTSKDSDSIAGDLAFYNFAQYAVAPRSFGGLRLGRMPRSVPSTPFNDKVLYLGCGYTYRSGLYRLGQLTRFGWEKGRSTAVPIAPIPPRNAPLSPILDQAGFVVLEPGCANTAVPALAPDFRRVGSRRREELWARVAH